jgi:hypothetical protein
VLDVTMRPDTGTRVERAKYLSYIAGAGCRCWPFHDELNKEFRVVQGQANSEIRAKGGFGNPAGVSLGRCNK